MDLKRLKNKMLKIIDEEEGKCTEREREENEIGGYGSVNFDGIRRVVNQIDYVDKGIYITQSYIDAGHNIKNIGKTFTEKDIEEDWEDIMEQLVAEYLLYD